MWSLSLKPKKHRLFFSVIFSLFIFVSPAFSAEVLQVRSSSLLQIGDQNRTYTVRLSCIESPQEYADDARNFLRNLLPRGQKVNLKPQGSSEGILIASVSKLGSSNDLSDELIRAGLGKSTC